MLRPLHAKAETPASSPPPAPYPRPVSTQMENQNQSQNQGQNRKSHLIDVAVVHQANDCFQLLHFHIYRVVILAKEDLAPIKTKENMRDVRAGGRGWGEARGRRGGITTTVPDISVVCCRRPYIRAYKATQQSICSSLHMLELSLQQTPPLPSPLFTPDKHFMLPPSREKSEMQSLTKAVKKNRYYFRLIVVVIGN